MADIETLNKLSKGARVGARDPRQASALQTFITDPLSLQADRYGKALFLDAHTDPVPNEANMLTLMTLKDFYTETDPAAIKALNQVGVEENRFLVEAAKILAGDSKKERMIQQKFGRDLTAARELGKYLKTRSDENLFNEIFADNVAAIDEARKEQFTAFG